MSAARAPVQTCAWCGRPPAEVYTLIVNAGVGICDQCIVLAAEELVAPHKRGPRRMERGQERGR